MILDLLQHATALHSLAHVVLADDGSGDDTGESKKAGPIGVVIIILLCIGCYFLFKSMSKHLRRVRDNFPEDLPPDPLHPDRVPSGQPKRSGPAGRPAELVKRPTERVTDSPTGSASSDASG